MYCIHKMIQYTFANQWLHLRSTFLSLWIIFFAGYYAILIWLFFPVFISGLQQHRRLLYNDSLSKKKKKCNKRTWHPMPKLDFILKLALRSNRCWLTDYQFEDSLTYSLSAMSTGAYVQPFINYIPTEISAPHAVPWSCCQHNFSNRKLNVEFPQFGNSAYVEVHLHGTVYWCDNSVIFGLWQKWPQWQMLWGWGHITNK